MNLSEMKSLLEYYVDDIVDNNIVIQLLNQAKNELAIVVDADFPDIAITPNMDDTFVFDDKYHNLPVLHAAAMVKAYDSSLGEKNSFMQQFQVGLQGFKSRYTVPIQYKLGANILQHLVTEENGVQQINVTSPNYHSWSWVNVYVDGVLIEGAEGYGKQINLPMLVPQGATITVEWDTNPMYQKPVWF